MLLPTRMAVLNHVEKVGTANLEEVMESLKPSYGSEKQFNKELYLIRNLKGLDLVKKVSQMRNERIKSTL